MVASGHQFSELRNGRAEEGLVFPRAGASPGPGALTVCCEGSTAAAVRDGEGGAGRARRAGTRGGQDGRARRATPTGESAAFPGRRRCFDF